MYTQDLPPLPRSFPVETLCALLTFLKRNDIEILQLVSKKFNFIIQDHSNILPIRVIPKIYLDHTRDPTGYKIEIMNNETPIVIMMVEKTEGSVEHNAQVTFLEDKKWMENCIFQWCQLPQLDPGVIQVLQHLRIFLGEKLRVINFDPGNLAIGISKLEAYKEVFDNLITVEKLAYIRFMNNELTSFLYDPKLLHIPFPPRIIHLNFDISAHPDPFSNFLTCEDIFGAERYNLRVEKPVPDEKFWENLVDKYLKCENPERLIRICEFNCSRRFMPREISRKFLEKRKIPCVIEKQDKSTSHVYTADLAKNWRLQLKFSKSQYVVEIFIRLFRE